MNQFYNTRHTQGLKVSPALLKNKKIIFHITQL